MSRIRTWLRLAEDLCARVAAPATDVANADREVEALLRASWLWSRGEIVVSKIQTAWLDSRCRRIAHLVRSIASSRA
jgi:hypothetical protein